MDRIALGQSGLTVSRLCLGSMGWGSRNTEAEGHAQIDRALEAGVNFIDTAEVYPTYPVKPETIGRTEEIIGNWFARTGRRDEVVLATKASSVTQKSVRGGAGFTGENLASVLEGSLKRLKTDHVDLYQLHFPMRGTAYHMRANWTWAPKTIDKPAIEAHMLGILQASEALIKAGKMRALGLSNETVWGAATWLRLADQNGLPRPVSIQNEYSLLWRVADLDMAEFCVAEGIAFLPFSPLAMGVLSGKYTPDVIPPNTRRAVEPTLNGRINPKVWPALDAYRAVADRHGLDATQMALAWTLTRPMVASSIFGASAMDQLELALGAADMTLSDEVLAEIDEVNRAHPMVY